LTPSFGSYLAGSLSLVAMAVALGYGAYHLRHWIVPEFSGALARLAELVFAISLLVLTLQLVGSAGLLTPGWILASCAVAGIAAGLLGRARAPAGAGRPVRPPRVSRAALLVAVGVASWTFAEWSISSGVALDRGMFGGDTTWYHMPFAARFAQDGSILEPLFTDPLRLAVWFYPQTYELLDGAGIVLLRSDFLAPLMNLGWLAFGFLAAWCIGRPYGVAPATLVAACLVFDSGVMWETQAGEARNDIMALALLLAFAAFILNGHRIKGSADGGDLRRGSLIDTGPLIVAGLAAGLAVSVKLTMLGPVGAIAIGVVVFSDLRARLRTLWVLGAALCVTGAFWYARNLLEAGNPLPLFKGMGPIALPHPDQMQLSPRPPHSVAGYLFEPSIYRQWFFPQLDHALGPLWVVLLIGGLTSAVYILLRARNPVLRVLTGAALLTAVVYLFTPITASGPYGQPKGFFTNTRYLMAALVLGLTLLPLARPLRATGHRRQVLALVTATFAITVLTTPAWRPAYIGGALFLTALVIWTPVAIAKLRSERGLGRLAVAATALAAAALAIVVGRAQEVQYAETRYTDPQPFFSETAGPVKAFAWARDTRDKRIGLIGAGQVFFTQYGWYGRDLSNYVQYVGVPGPDGAFTVPRTCRALRTRVNAGNYDYLVSTRYGTNDEDMKEFPVRAWLKDDPALKQIVAEEVTPQADWVYRVEGRLDPGGCSRPDR
jgi:hypothetical protein